MIHLSRAIEAGARAIYESRNGKGCKPWRYRDARHKEPYLLDAKAVLAALAAEGLIVVPATPTDDMDLAGSREVDLTNPYPRDVAANVYLTMIQAAQGGDDAGQ